MFKVSAGELESHLRIRHPRITIAGQTAPGDGICLRRYPLVISADDVIVRFLRVRLGDEAGRKMDGIDVSDAENVIVDHCSVSWTLDEAVNTYHGSKNITIQWCLISESLHDSPLQEGHGFAASLGGFNSRITTTCWPTTPGAIQHCRRGRRADDQSRLSQQRHL